MQTKMLRPFLTVVLLASGVAAVAGGGADVLGKAGWGLISPKGGADLTRAAGGVLHAVVRVAASKYYQTQLTHDVAEAVPAGTTLLYKFSARSASKNPIHVVIEKREAPYTHHLDQIVALTGDWKPYSFKTTIPKAYGAGELAARLQLGQQAGQVDFKDIAVVKVDK